MIRVLSKRINSGETFNLQKSQYSEKLVISDTVPANSQKLAKKTISNLGHFLVTHLTGSMTTLRSYPGQGGAFLVDDGVDYLSAMLSDSTGNRALFSDFIPLSLFLSPGRRRDFNAQNNIIDIGGIALRAYDANNLFYPLEFEYFFAANSDILFNVINASNVPNHYTVVFHGIRVLTNVSVIGIKQR